MRTMVRGAREPVGSSTDLVIPVHDRRHSSSFCETLRTLVVREELGEVPKYMGENPILIVATLKTPDMEGCCFPG